MARSIYGITIMYKIALLTPLPTSLASVSIVALHMAHWPYAISIIKNEITNSNNMKRSFFILIIWCYHYINYYTRNGNV